MCDWIHNICAIFCVFGSTFNRAMRTACAEIEDRRVIRKLERRAGIEPANTGFADQRVSHFATGALRAAAGELSPAIGRILNCDCDWCAKLSVDKRLARPERIRRL
jgi:hypothetical protein